MDFDLAEKDKNLSWWWSQLESCKDWNSMTVKMKKDLTIKIQQGIQHLTDLNISREEIIELIKLTDFPTVWDAIISLCAVPVKSRHNQYQMINYFRNTVLNLWSEKHPVDERVWQKLPDKESRRKKGKPVSWEKVLANDPTNFKRGGDVIGRPKKVTIDVRVKVIALKKEGMSANEIRHHLSDKISLSSIYKICSEM